MKHTRLRRSFSDCSFWRNVKNILKTITAGSLQSHRSLLFALLLIATGVCADEIDDGLSAYRNGNYSVALQKFGKAAVQGKAVAQYNLATMYANGNGVVQDFVEAVRWYELAADQGNAAAQSNFAHAYHIGKGMPQDLAEAVRWYKLAAAQGEGQAQLNLAYMYAKGEGLVKDYARAHMWSNLAGVSGNPKGALLRDAVAAMMTQQQIVDAQRLARDCLARSFKSCD